MYNYDHLNILCARKFWWRSRAIKWQVDEQTYHQKTSYNDHKLKQHSNKLTSFEGRRSESRALSTRLYSSLLANILAILIPHKQKSFSKVSEIKHDDNLTTKEMSPREDFLKDRLFKKGAELSGQS